VSPEPTWAQREPVGGATPKVVKPATPQKELIFLFSSVPADRPNYKRGVLDALCYPSGHTLEVSYRKSYFQPALAQNLDSLRNKQAVFVFIDYSASGSTLTFIPVRYGKILECRSKGSSTQIGDRTRIYIRLELDDLIPVEDLWDTWIKGIPGSPKPKGETARSYLVLANTAPIDKPTSSQDEIWFDLVEKVAKAPVLDDCIFLSTGKLQKLKENTDCAFLEYGKDQKAYQLRPSNLYKMELRIFDKGNKPDTNQEIYVRCSSDLVTVSQPFATSIGGPSEHAVLLNCKRSIEDTLATLVVDVRQAEINSNTQSKTPITEGADAGPAGNAVICAKPIYFLNVSVLRSILWWLVILVFFGVLLTSTSPEFFKEEGIQKLLCWMPGTPSIWALGAKMLGAVCLAIAAYLGFRKLPTGSPGG
jgi:hypothetical protein